MIDPESLLEPVPGDQPGGPCLEYDPAFLALNEAATGTPERQMGDSLIPAQDPDWRRVLELGTGVLGRSKDLHAAVLVTRALLGLEGLRGLEVGLRVILGLIERYWDDLYPALDPDDDNDPTGRVNLLLELTDRDTLLVQLRNVPLIRSRAFGPIAWRDIDIAEGRAQPAPGAEPLEGATIAAAFQDCDLDALAAAVAATEGALASLTALDRALEARIGRGQLPSLAPLAEMLKPIGGVLRDHLGSRQPAGADGSGADPAGPADAEPGARSAAVPQTPGQINSREDVVRALGRICDYYSKHEPSSPVPLLLKRAQRLATGSFVDILRDLAPEGLPQAAKALGIEEPS